MSKLYLLLHSRKFWALIAAIVAVATALATGQISEWQALQAAIAALAAYITGTAIDDAGNMKPA
jgi:ABC-type branched-subunit amino acid transport system permease subunit